MEVSNPDGANVAGQPVDPAPEAVAEPELAPISDVERFLPPKRKRPSGGRKLLIILLVLILAAGAAGYWWFTKHTVKSPVKQVSAGQHAPTPTTQTASGSTTYTAKGQDLNLSFTYPSSWTATPASGSDTTDQPISVTSPFVSITSADGQTVTGKVVVAIRPATSAVSELAANNPTEALDSTQFAYTSPTPNQHQYPYLSYVHFSNGQNVPGAFEELFVTGVNQLLKGYPVESIGTDPIISVGIYQCSTQACTDKGAAPLSITLTTWQNSGVTTQAQTILSSLQFH